MKNSVRRSSHFFAKQVGFTLIEVLVVLTIAALVIGGALALASTSQSSQQSTQLIRDLSSIRSSVSSTYQGQGYGTSGTNLNQVLINAKRIPTTMSVVAGTPPVINTNLNQGTLVIASAVSNFTMTATLMPTDICLATLVAIQGFNSITVGAATAVTTFPISPTTASTLCSAATTQTIIFQSA